MKKKRHEMILYYNEVNQRIRLFERNEFENKEIVEYQSHKRNNLFNIYLFLYSFIDLLLLTFLLIKSRITRTSLNLIYTFEGLCSIQDNKYSERIIQNLEINNKVYINQGTENIIKLIDGFKVYNIGGIVKLIAYIIHLFDQRNNLIRAYSFVNDYILSISYSNSIYLLCHYDRNGISVVFSKYRNSSRLIEVQHGGIINYPSYLKPSSIKIADVFIVRNKATVAYLQTHLNQFFKSIEYEILPYPKNTSIRYEGINILYASSIETNGFHPLFLAFLDSSTESNIFLTVRLHPREKNKKAIFEEDLAKYDVNYQFDDSINWLENNKILNLIVISPWSSIIEEAADNKITAIIIDILGQKRYANLIDNQVIYFANAGIQISTIIDKLHQ